ncbi:hypothetical protein [Pseudomonas frederiksbergensis]|uniref:Uncharacterized protein n=1 Tax=Pseudomonas frederiksbergensis TaxID=104087 RepID=A0A423K7A1_9PSED|nr:hypothetical protein [Pseudomonas frederiksbergensis]RON47656.1 hypothetical protein BK665_25220 [Pseudomonas frederiksbergensis]
MALLEPLDIQEAVDGVINLKDVPNGATARIAEPPNHTPDDLVSVLIADKEVVSDAPAGEWVDGFLSVTISRAHLLNHTGPQKKFSYILYYGGANRSDSEPTYYDIAH